jgi:hypothetical protein
MRTRSGARLQEEMDSLHTNHTHELLKFPKGEKVLKNKWVYIIKQRRSHVTSKVQGRASCEMIQLEKKYWL